MKLILLFALLGLCAEPLTAALSAAQTTQVLDSMLKGYDKRVQPDNQVDVEVSVFIIKQWGYCNKNNDFAVEYYFRQGWEDKRLAVPGRSDTMIIGGQDIMDLLWKPDTFFANDNAGHLGQLTVPNTFVRLTGNGTIFMSSRYTTRVTCTGDLKSFPRDLHVCTLNAESYGYDKKVISYHWRDGKAVGVGTNLTGFDTLSIHTASDEVELKSGTYSTVKIEFVIQRQSQTFITRFFIPAMVTALMSFVPLFMSKSSGKSRQVLSVLIFVGYLIFATSTYATVTPRNGSGNMVDCFLFINFIFVASSFFVVSYITIATNKQRGHGDAEKVVVIDASHEKISRVNQVARIGVPSLYILFNLIFWFAFFW